MISNNTPLEEKEACSNVPELIFWGIYNQEMKLIKYSLPG